MLAGQADPFGYRTAGRCLLKGKRTPRPGMAGVAPWCARPMRTHREKLDITSLSRVAPTRLSPNPKTSSRQPLYARYVGRGTRNKGIRQPSAYDRIDGYVTHLMSQEGTPTYCSSRLVRRPRVNPAIASNSVWVGYNHRYCLLRWT